MRRHLFTIALIFFLAASCSKSDEQRKFEREARSEPNGITEMDVHGSPVENRNDPDDWRTAPLFQGLIKIDSPAYPNPVALNSQIKIIVDVTGFETVSGLEVYSFRFSNDPLNGPLYMNDESLPPGLETIVLDPNQLRTGPDSGESSVLYRIILFDGRENVISYGDVEVQQ